MGFFSTIGNAICSVAKAACSVISSAASVIGGGVKEAAMQIAGLGVSLASKVAEAIKSVGILLGVINPEENLDELGEKAMMSDKKPEDFDSINEYIDHLRNDVVIDRENFSSLDEKELLARSAIGASITLKGINDKLGTSITPEFMAAVALQELEAEEIVATIDTYKKNNLSTEEYNLYINDELDIAESNKHSNALVDAYQKLEPELSIEQIEDKVMGLKS